MFDSNAMAELAALKRARGGGRRKDGANKTVSARSWHDNRTRDMSTWQRAVYEARHRWEQAASNARENFRLDCWVDVDGTWLGDGIPF